MFGLIYDIVLTSEGSILLSDSQSKRIMELSQGKEPTTLFNTRIAPTGLCCLQDGEILVAFQDEGRVVLCNRAGGVTKELDSSHFSRPYRVATNKFNHNIHVCDRGDPSKKIIAFDATCKYRYEYRGLNDGHFDPFEVCADSMGHVLITEPISSKVHILDQDGQFLNYLLFAPQQIHLPNTIDVDDEGYVWIGQQVSVRNKGRVTVIKYLT